MTSLNLNPLLEDLNTVTLGGGEGSPCQSGEVVENHPVYRARNAFKLNI